MKNATAIKRLAIHFVAAFVICSAVFFTCVLVDKAIGVNENNALLQSLFAIASFGLPFLIFPVFSLLSISAVQQITTSNLKRFAILFLFAVFPFIFSAIAIIAILLIRRPPMAFGL